MSQVALTTIFTPPASCSNNVYTSIGASIYEKDVSITSSQCYPSNFQSLFTASKPFSPGVCPSGYEQQGHTPYHDSATAALCCPSGMTAYDAGLGCSLQITAPTVLSVDAKPTTISKGDLAVHGVYVAWASSDLSLLPSTSGPASASHSSLPSKDSNKSSSPGGKASVAAKQTKSPDDRNSKQPGHTPTIFVTSTPSNHHKSTLSTGAEAGIGVGVGIVGVALIAAGILLLLRKMRQRRSSAGYQSSVEAGSSDEQFTHWGPSHIAEKRHISELSSETPLSELCGSSPALEVEGEPRRAELEGC